MAGVYPLSRDTAESERLTIQHKLSTQLLGFLVHPVIKTPLTTPSLQIADIATGTGIFLFDVAEQALPSSQLHGFDISDAQFPPLDKRPENLHFHLQDIREEFEDQYWGKFDIINIRLVFLGLKGNDWDKAVKNVVKLLKPGGYIQWIEMDHSHSKILHNKPGAPDTAAKEVNSLAITWFQENILPDPLRLPTIFNENNLEMLADETWATDRLRHMGLLPTTFFLGNVGKLVLDILVKEGKMKKENVDELLKKAIVEGEDGDIYQHSDGHVYVGRKPL